DCFSFPGECGLFFCINMQCCQLALIFFQNVLKRLMMIEAIVAAIFYFIKTDSIRSLHIVRVLLLVNKPAMVILIRVMRNRQNITHPIPSLFFYTRFLNQLFIFFEY